MLRNPLRVLALLLAVPVMALHAQTAANYDALVQQGKTQLQAGSNDAALASANAAIKLDGTRWEAYAVAGGALINLKRCEEAKADLDEAIVKAPGAKQTVLQNLESKCTASAQDNADTGYTKQESGPSYEDTVRWIRGNFAKLGLPGAFQRVNDPINPNSSDRFNSQSSYLFSTTSCDAQITQSETGTLINHGMQSTGGSDTVIFRLPLAHVSSVGTVVSTTFKMPAIAITEDSDLVAWSRTFTDPDSGTSTKDGKAHKVEIPLGSAEAQDIGPHMIVALQHLVALCKSNPNLKSKGDLF
jgi:hypothetical protein